VNTLIFAGLITLSPIAPLHGGGMPHNPIQVEEDSPYFDCRVDGNQVCGPENPWGFAPGYYGQGHQSEHLVCKLTADAGGDLFLNGCTWFTVEV
jgi:hypothetical protein